MIRSTPTPPPRQTVERLLRGALAGIGWDMANSVYRGKADRYIVINHSDSGADHGDDDPGVSVARVQVHLYAPLAYNILAVERAAKRAVRALGATWPDREDASDGDMQHIVLEFELAVEVETDGTD